METTDTPRYATAHSFVSGMHEHAVRHGTDPAGSPRPTRVGDYKVPYLSECGREVALRAGSVVLDGAENVHDDHWAYRWVTWPSWRGLRCRSCTAKVQARKQAQA